MDEMDVPAGLIKVAAADTFEGWCLVEIGSELHRQYMPDDLAFAEPEPVKKAKK